MNIVVWQLLVASSASPVEQLIFYENKYKQRYIETCPPVSSLKS